ncbi:MAG TPA: PD-(D/E)XK nuclease family protein, partial [Ktedonobacteraceae bacterium]|nr:PD-(D/E)XK nuclease family protein [Ktedonobacteraceae bacterium]
MHTSHSSINSYVYCGKAFELEKIQGYQGPPAWWLLGGSAVHTATEWLDTDGWDGSPEEAFHYAFYLECQDARESGWEDESQWRSAGYGRNQQGFEFWSERGAQYVRQWADRNEHWDWVELDVSTVLPSGIEIRGYIDRARRDPNIFGYQIADLKTGSTRPDSDQQLGI